MIPRLLAQCHLFTIALTLAILAPATFANDAHSAMEMANRYLKMGMYLEAIGAYRDVTDQSTDYDMQAKALVRIGDIYGYFLNNYNDALEHYSFVVQRYSKSLHAANAFFNIGMILYEKNKYGNACAWFQEYLKRFPRGTRRQTAEFMVESCMTPPPAASERKPDTALRIRPDETIRVLTHENLTRVQIMSDSSYDITEPEKQHTIVRIQGSRRMVVEFREGHMWLNGAPLRYDRIVVTTPEATPIAVNEKTYRGEVSLRETPHGITVVNTLGLEEYLYGVLPKEMSPRWPLEALKAQAVAARTYALYQKEKGKDKGYDVYASTYSQVYEGYRVESEMTTRAVNETRGQVILHGGRLILAYFHSNSGGVTEDAQHVWTADVPYLRGVRDDFSTKGSNYQWTHHLDMETIRTSLGSCGVSVGSLYGVAPVKVSPSGRVQTMQIIHSRGEMTMSGNQFRLKIDPKLIKSTLFELQRDASGISIRGRGYGHGVGMSQWGAYHMAKGGHPYTEILKYYYSDVEVR